ncbi:MAG: hypothetical protein WAQ28_14705 [Bacteroidia bacterium]
MTYGKKLLVLSLVALLPILAVAQKTSNHFVYEPLPYLKDKDIKFLENYNKGVEHYNKAVAIIRSSDSYIDLKELETIRDSATEELKLALPYMENAYKLNPKEENALLGLCGIHFALENMDKEARYRDEYDALHKK